MSKSKTVDWLSKIPVVKWVIQLLKGIKLPGFEGLSLLDLLVIYIRGIVEGALGSRAGSVAFSLFLAIFPLLIFLFTLVPFVIPFVAVGDANFDAQLLVFLESFLPTATGEYFTEVYQQMKDQKRGGLLSSAFLISIFLVANGVSSIFSAFEYSYHTELTRNYFKQYAYAFMVGLILSVLILIGAIFFVYFEFYVIGYTVEFLGEKLGIKNDKEDLTLIWLAKTAFYFLLSYMIVSVLYYFGTADSKKARFFTPGALMTSVLFLLTSYLFGIYIDSFARYNELYGALSGLMILLVFIWLNSNILLLGYELNATLRTLKSRYDQIK
jgi:membrane protein